ncbi:hypothetical protein [Paenibacillus oralis]|uniref:hypothetical protein n=1 Tax=Paenibacillus oralis TaxID=2490856 RepID=UPI0015B045C4|nr:hypothetical protein [Paenibacillus oralis]
MKVKRREIANESSLRATLDEMKSTLQGKKLTILRLVELMWNNEETSSVAV